MSEGLYFRQLLAGRDFATDDPAAASMVNFVYLIGDPETRECVVVDPAWDVQGLVDIVDADGMTLVGALGTHYHPDHIGGSMFGFTVPGTAALNAIRPVKLHVNEHEAEGVKKITGLSESDIVRHAGGDALRVGSVEIRFVHTPGHTPGSQCFLVGNRLVSGDTLFVQGCGRVDLPGSDPAEMYETLTQRLSKLPDDTVLYPGHDYGHSPTSTMGAERRENYYLRVPSLDAWLAMMGR